MGIRLFASDLPAVDVPAALEGPLGILVCVSIGVDPHELEQLLDTLSRLPFPVNPEISHRAWAQTEQERVPASVVDFPAWSRQIGEIQDALAAEPIHPLGFEVRGALSDEEPLQAQGARLVRH